KNEFPEIDFQRAVMVGDSVSDIAFGQNLGMSTVLIEGKMDEVSKLEQALSSGLRIDLRFESLWEFAAELMKTQPR
ncbi:MAG TPA: HAD hydrolase-like protein, partial [Haliscomenobacter sp.]|uniref:HAD hydrolase-like protein n=1 Tax=Haliscomenobacter sp. TaxID=2717303 RepID=UPI002BBB0CC2